MSAFDPFTSTLEQAMAQPDADAEHGAVLRWGSAQQLIGQRKFYESNPLDGMAHCAINGLAAPDWLARAYLRCWRRVASCEVRTWDEAFGAAFPPGTNLAAARRARRHRFAAANAFADILQRDPDRRVDKALWAEVGNRIGEGATRAEELYRQALERGFALHAYQIKERSNVRPTRFRKPAGKRRPW